MKKIYANQGAGTEGVLPAYKPDNMGALGGIYNTHTISTNGNNYMITTKMK
jgi:hypothetical protein